MASALSKLRKARQGSGTSLASPTITSSSAGTSSSGGGSALSRLRAARSGQSLTSKPTLTAAAQIYASDEEKKRNSQTSANKNVGGLLGGIGYTIEKAGLGFLQGVEGVVDYAVGGIAELFGNDDFSEEVIANDWLDYNHADTWYKPDDGWKFVGDVASGIGTSLPGIAAGTAVGIATGGTGLGTAAGLILSGFSAAGTSTKEAYLESGKLTGKEFGYGALMGGVEAGTEWATGLIGTGLTKAVSSVTSALGKVASKTAASVTLGGTVKQLGKEFISEAFEEGVAEILSPVAKRLTYDKNAEFASVDEVAYAALVGGLSGVVMGGFGMGSRSIRHIASGKKISDSGKISETLDLGRMYSDVESNEATGSASIKAISEIMSRIGDVSDGKKLTVNQRRMLGELAEYTTVAPLENVMRKSAITAVRGAEPIAKKLASDGNVKMVDGKLTYTTPSALENLIREGKEVRDITAEDITKGYDQSKPASILSALQKNEVLRYVAASDAAGRLMLSASQVEEAALTGSTIRNQVDLNRFIEETNKSPEKRAALGRELGIQENEWDTLQLGRFNEAIRAYRESGKADAYKHKIEIIEKAKAIPEGDAKKKMPNALTLGDGMIRRYKTEKADIAIARDGSSYMLYDYNLGDTSRSLTRAEANTLLHELKAAGEVNIPTDGANTPENAENSVLKNQNQGNMGVIGENSLSPNARRAVAGVTYAESYKRRVDAWDQKTEGFSFVLGDTSHVIADIELDGKRIGNKQIRLDASKVKTILKEHPEMDIEVIKKLPNITENPILVLESKTQKGRIVLFGEVNGKNGKPVMLAIELNPKTRTGKSTYLDIVKIASAYTRTNTQNLINTSVIKYVDKNNDRVDNWLKVNRLQLPLPNSQNNSVKNSIPNSGEKVNTSEQKSSEKSTKERIAEVRERLDAKKIDKYLTENVEEYSSFGEQNKSMIRKVVREGRANGLGDSDVLTYARAASRTGINVEFDTAMKDGEAGYFDPDKNRIVINPKTTKKHELLLIHELDHAIRAYIGNDGKIHYLAYKDADKKVSEKTRKHIKEHYADQKIDISREELFADEASAYYSEAILGGDKFIDLLLGKEPTLQQRILSFFTGAAQSYSKDPELAKAARAHYRSFKKMFADFAERNKGRNAETAVDNGKSTVESEKSVRKTTDLGSKYSYDILTKKSDLSVVALPKLAEIPKKQNGNQDNAEIARIGKSNARKQNNPNNTDTDTYVYVDDIGLNVLLGTKGLIHGLARSEETALAVMKIGEILKRSVAINELNGEVERSTEMSYVLLGVCQDSDNMYVVRSIVGKLDNNVTNMDIYRLGAVKGKKTGTPNSALKRGAAVTEQSSLISSEFPSVSIADFLKYVKDIPMINEVFSEDVAKKLGVTRTSGTLTPSLRYSTNFEAKLSDPDKVTISKGQAWKQKANYNSDRVYSKKDVANALGDIEGFGNLPEDVRDEIFRDVWVGLNSHYGESNRKIFIETMEHKVPYMLMTNALTEENLIKYKELVKEKWRAKKKFKGEALEKRLSEIDREIESIRGAADHLFDTYDQERIDEIKQEVVDKLNKLLDGGKPSLRAKMESEFNKSDAGKWKTKYDEALKQNNILDQARKMRELHLETFLNSTDYNNHIFEDTFETLRSITYRGNINDAKVREKMKNLVEWYKPDNPVLKEMDGVPGSMLYSDYIALAINDIASGEGKLTMHELELLDNVMRHATRMVENFNRIWKNGKWQDAAATAKSFVEVANTTTRLRSSADIRKFTRLFESAKRWYLTSFGDPMTVFRYMDGYQDGFFTWAGEELRAGAFRHGVDVMEMKTDYDAFLKDRKGYLKKASLEAVEYGGAKMSKLQYISLYMTMQREQAQRGLGFNGFSLIDLNGRRVEVDGFISRVEARLGAELGISKDPDGTWQVSDEQMKRAVDSEISEMKKKLTVDDLQFVEIIERTLNGKCKELKTARDMERLGFSNTISGYYYPIARAMIARTIDSRGMWGELDRASNISANKNTVRGAAGALWIESVDTVFTRHIDAVARYAELSPAIDAINKVFNLDVSGNKNKPRSVRTATFNTWQIDKILGGTPSDAQKHNGEAYLKDLLADLQGISKERGVGARAVESIRSGFAISSLAANPKVLLTQLSSLFASTNILPYKSLVSGFWRGFNHGAGGDLDKYCPIAKLRNYDSSAAKAQGVVENVRGVGEWLMGGVSFMDRCVVRALWGACQTEIESTKGLKVGTEENMTEAGKLLEHILQETQQGSVATEKSAAMRSTNFLMKSITMFTSDAMKGAGRFIDANGHVASCEARLKTATGEEAEALRAELEDAKSEARRSLGALAANAIYMTLIARLFSFLYAKDEEEKYPVLAFAADVFGGMIGGLPGFSDLYDFFSNGYDISDSVYDSVNDVLTAVRSIFTTATKWAEGEATGADANGTIISLVQSLCTATGIPFRNIRKTLMGLIRRFDPNSAYRLEMLTESKSYAYDFEQAMNAGDEDKAIMILEMLLSERLTREGESVSFANSAYLAEVFRLDKAGYNVKPRTIGDSVTIDGMEVELTPEEQAALRARYSEAVGDIEALIASDGYSALTDEEKERAIRSVYDTYYDLGIYELYGYDRNAKRRVISKIIPSYKLALITAATAGIESDYEGDEAVSGSKRKKVIAAINKMPLTTAEKLLAITYKGYALKDGDIRGIRADRAKKLLISYLLGASISREEKAAVAAACGFTVKNGKISLK